MVQRDLLQEYFKQLTVKLREQGRGLDQKRQDKISKEISFRVEQFVDEIGNLWKVVDGQQESEITKNKFYKFLSENKILQNADQAKTEEMLRNVMVTWGPG